MSLRECRAACLARYYPAQYVVKKRPDGRRRDCFFQEGDLFAGVTGAKCCLEPDKSIMTDLQLSIIAFGPLLVFINVLVEQAGLPVPAYPLLVMTGALIALGDISWPMVLLSATLACVIADTAWYFAGRRFGAGLLNLVCRVSVSRDVCINQTQALYVRVGLRSLLVAKFLPGAGALSTVMAGLTGAPLLRFLRFDIAGSLIWICSALLLGATFRDTVVGVLDAVSVYGGWAASFIAMALAIYIGQRAARRVLTVRRYRHVPRLTAERFYDLHRAGPQYFIVDMRSYADGRIPGAIFATLQTPFSDLGIEPRLRILVYCNCPEEMSAAMFADRLILSGYSDVSVLVGGYDAWHAVVSAKSPALGASDEPGGKPPTVLAKSA
jgi:membrane protein DedA with SNARE-associated domain/rhodanese-related sulfurtransferase